MSFRYNSVVESVIMGNDYVEMYKTNEHTSISERMMRFVISKDDASHYRRLKKLQHHNLLSIFEVGEAKKVTSVLYRSMKQSGDEFGPLNEYLSHPFFSFLALNFPDGNTNLKILMSDIVTGAAILHKHSLYHGNITIESVYFYLRKGSYRPTFILGNFKKIQGQDSQMMAVLKDFKDIGLLLENLMDSICIAWRADVQMTNFRGLCEALSDGMSVSKTYPPLQSAAEASLMCQQYISIHPGLLNIEDRPFYVLKAFVQIWFDGLWLLVKDSDFDGELNVPSSWVRELIAKNTIDVPFDKLNDGMKGRPYLIMIRNLVGHPPESNSIVGADIGTTSVEVVNYFQTAQPKFMLVLYDVVKRSEFEFHSFVSRNPQAFHWTDQELEMIEARAKHKWVPLAL